MNRMLTAILLVVPSLGLAACNVTVTDGRDVGISKDEARALGGVDADGNDICAEEGWYDDGVCDDFCVEPDALDCQVPPSCPDPNDPAVHYVSEPGNGEVCEVIDFACSPDQVMFGSGECGCGCIDVANPGPTCGGFGGVACDEGFFCNYPLDAMCGNADQTGTCEPIPEACPENYGPVCGCDGVTYDNACFAHGAGVSVAHDGACDGGGGGTVCGGFTGTICGSDEFCNFPIDAMCGEADQTGTCEPIPQGCDAVYAPVCGCDGATYTNACVANNAGVSVAAEGACP